MKVVITCDHLIKRDLSVNMLDVFLGLYKEATIMTLSHVPGGVLGKPELRKIRSSFLSQKWTTLEDKNQFCHLLPTAAKKLFVPCSTDLLINISTGFSHGMKKCKEVKQVTYLLDWPWWSNPAEGLKQKMFRAFSENFALKSLEQVDELWVSNPKLKDYLVSKGFSSDIKILPPYVKVEDYPILKGHGMPKNYWVVEGSSLDHTKASQLFSLSKKFVVVGEDAHLEEVKKISPHVTFFGERCSGEMAPVLGGCAGYLTFDSKSFPTRVIETLSSGRPVVIPQGHDFVGLIDSEGTFEFSQVSQLESLLDRVEKADSELEAEKLKSKTNQFMIQAFRGKVQRNLESFH